MFCTHVLHSLKYLRVSQSCSSVQVAILRHAASFSVCGVTGLKPLDAGRRSSRALKQPSICPLPRWFSSAAPSEDGKLIYTGTLGRVVRGVKLFSYSTSLTSMVIIPQVLLKTGLGVDSLVLQVLFWTVVGGFTFITPILLHLMTKSYVLRLYHRPDSDTYTAVTYSALLMEKKNVFHQSQVSIPPLGSMFTNFYANDRGFLVNPDLFDLPHDYNHLMGYDKPFSFREDDLDQPDRS